VQTEWRLDLLRWGRRSLFARMRVVASLPFARRTRRVSFGLRIAGDLKELASCRRNGGLLFAGIRGLRWTLENRMNFA